MNEQAQRQAQSREIALRDLQDIRALRESVQFNRYFVRRLNERHDAIALSFKYDKVDPVEREVLRRLVLEYESIAGMMLSDEKGCHRLVESSLPSDPALAGTHGNG